MMSRHRGPTGNRVRLAYQKAFFRRRRCALCWRTLRGRRSKTGLCWRCTWERGE